MERRRDPSRHRWRSLLQPSAAVGRPTNAAIVRPTSAQDRSLIEHRCCLFAEEADELSRIVQQK